MDFVRCVGQVLFLWHPIICSHIPFGFLEDDNGGIIRDLDNAIWPSYVRADIQQHVLVVHNRALTTDDEYAEFWKLNTCSSCTVLSFACTSCQFQSNTDDEECLTPVCSACVQHVNDLPCCQACFLRRALHQSYSPAAMASSTQFLLSSESLS